MQNILQRRFFGLQIRSLLALTSGFIIMLQLGTIYTMGTFLPYLASYLHYYNEDPNISTKSISYIILLMFLGINLGLIISSFIPSHIPHKIVLIFSMTAMAVCVFFCSFSDKIWQFMVFYAFLNGILIGFGYIRPLMNCYSYLPHKKGLCAGVCIMGFGLSSVIFNQILQKVVNPNNFPPSGVNKYFPEQVANNVPFAIRIMSIVYLGIAVLGLSLFYQKPLKPKSQLQEQSQQVENVQPISLSYLINSNNNDSLEKMHWLLLTILFGLPYGYFIAMSYKEYGQNFFSDDSFLTITGTIGSIGNGFCRLFWGHLLDRFTFKQVAIVMYGILTVCCFTIGFIGSNAAIFTIIVFLTYFSYGGLYCLLPTQAVRVLGTKQGSFLYPYLFIGFSVGTLIEFLVHQIIIVDANLEVLGFQYCFGLFGLFQIFGLILIMVVKYEYHHSQLQYTKEQKLIPVHQQLGNEQS